ncbi:MAG: RidA family protein [Planctomycetia bacterium]|nr:RidA family protein [Planctomycetia bacterium]
MSTIEAKLQEIGLPLPVAPPAVGSYIPVVRSGYLVITSGQLPFVGKEIAFKGKLGAELHEQDGWNAARLCVVNALAQIKGCVGSLEKISRIIRVEGYVHSAPGFQNQPKVLNGASELLLELFGEAGRHTRIALGVAEMPLNAAVQLCVWAEVTG